VSPCHNNKATLELNFDIKKQHIFVHKAYDSWTLIKKKCENFESIIFHFQESILLLKECQKVKEKKA
jgi:hypothetical protein